MIDLTIIFLTTNKVPKDWAEFHKKKLLEAAGDYPIISISCQPVDIGTNILQTEPLSKPNIFYQMLRGAKMVKTPYLAVAEDDTLYTKNHFRCYRHPNAFCYNQNKWALYTWDPTYSLKSWIRTNAVMVAPTQLTIDTLEERFKKYPWGGNMPHGMDGELGVYEKVLGITPRSIRDFKSTEPVVQLDHDFFTIGNPLKETIERRHTKKLGDIQAYDIPVWGRAEDLIKEFK